MENNIKYYKRKSGIIVRVINDAVLEYYKDGKWIRNQEWFYSMFNDHDDDFEEINKELVLNKVKK